MAGNQKTLFEPVVDAAKQHSSFEKIRTQPQAKPTRWMLDRVFQDFDDPDGNFLEQFQTTAFDARFFELYLFAYFSRSGFSVSRKEPNPDFLVERNGVKVAVEATTVNRSMSGVLADAGKSLEDDLSAEEFADYEQNELPIRFGSPLFSKLNQRYWELEHCRGLPLVIAIEAFHDQGSLGMTDIPLKNYLYGQKHQAGWSRQGTLKIESKAIDEHKLAEKVIPSGFFKLEDCQHISAVIFSNSGTMTKFARMGFQHGIGCDEIEMIRKGFAFNPGPDAADATLFSYNMDAPPLIETWGQGLVVCHNPRCIRKIPLDYFPDAVQCYVEGDQVVSLHRSWHPYASNTINVHLGEGKKELKKCTPYRDIGFAVAAISKAEFYAAWGGDESPPASVGEHGWFRDDTGGFMGVVYRGKSDDDWGFAIFARDEQFKFCVIEWGSALRSRQEARIDVQLNIAQMLQSPQRIFPAAGLEPKLQSKKGHESS